MSVEAVYLAEAGWRPLTSCDLPVLPQPRWAHTQGGPLVCGGYSFGEVGLDVMSSCVSLRGQGGEASYFLRAGQRCGQTYL